MSFVNPYHFVPADFDPDSAIPRDEVNGSSSKGEKSRQVAHDRYARTTARSGGEAVHSGKIVCRIVVERPVVVGAYRSMATDRSPSEVEPYEVPGRRADGSTVAEPAIPASSLKGMFSSVFESVTGSSLRVLADTPLATRMEFANAHSATGMIVVIDKRRYLAPLTFPTLFQSAPRKWSLPKAYAPYANRMGFRIFPSGRLDDELKRVVATGPDAKVEIAFVDRYRAAPLDGVDGLEVPEPTDAKTKDGPSLIGRAVQQAIPRADWLRLSASEKAKYMPCLIRNMHVQSDQGLARDFRDFADRRLIPQSHRRHAWLLPIPDAFYDPEKNVWNFPRTKIAGERIFDDLGLIDVEDAAREFEAEARMRTLDDRRTPFELNGSLRNDDVKSEDKPESFAIRLRELDLVCWSPKPDGGISLAISSIWRKPHPSVHRQFEKLQEGKGAELLPMHAGRTLVSLAEQIFGYVEGKSSGSDSPETVSSSESKRVVALAGRLRFSDARVLTENHPDGGDWYSKPGVARILASPKPPCPAMYFRTSDGKHGVRKSDFGKGDHVPQGRKRYVHHVNDGRWTTGEGSSNLKQKSRFRRLRKNVALAFEIRFDNLSESELAVLTYAIQPSDKFRHLIGGGKPLGCGTIRVEPLALLFVDRRRRYAVDPPGAAPRFSKVCISEGVELGTLVESMPDETKKLFDDLISALACGVRDDERLRQLRDEGKNAVDRRLPRVARALELLGDPTATKGHTVDYPRSVGNENGESELFQWYTNNEHPKQANPQFLRPIDASDKTGKSAQAIPYLEPNDEPPTGRNRH